MPNRETVITHLQIIHTWAEFARERDLQFFTAKHLEDIAEWTDDALILLKEQEDDIGNLNETVKNLLNTYTEIKAIYGGVELVRCKDCTHWDEKKHECHNVKSYMQYRPCFKDWYCADGERRSE